jgi:amino acid permease
MSSSSLSITSIDIDNDNEKRFSESSTRTSDHNTRVSLHKNMTEDERRLAALGYKQEVKRIFNTFTSFGLTASMISVLLGVVPLYTFSLSTGGPAVQLWSWVIVFFFTYILVSSLAEIACAFPTMVINTLSLLP